MSTGLGELLDAIDAKAAEEVADDIDLDDCPDEFLVSRACMSSTTVPTARSTCMVARIR
eukprot:COSAG02_NODE_13465_length_1391_cov_2.779412_3_plen_59_part_00